MLDLRAWSRVAVLALVAVACGRADDAAEPGPAEDADVSTAGSVGYTLTGLAPRATGGFPSVVQLFLVSEGDGDGDGEGEAEGENGSEPEPVLMDQYGNEFHPSVLIVRTGGVVSFKNSEDVLHNVRVVNRETHETIFNVGTPVVGSYEHRFEESGVYDVSCQIHPSMAAFLVVTDAAHVVVAEGRGAFTLEGIPAGSYIVRVWNLDEGRKREGRITLDSDVTLDLSREEGDAE